MKKLIFSLLISTSLIFVSCEDPIDLDLGEAKIQIVVDAVINQTTDTQFINITQSLPFLSSSTYSGVTADTVAIFDASNFAYYEFTHLGGGKYFYVPNQGDFDTGKTYQLYIRHGANTYVSQSHLHSPVTIDSFVAKYEENGRFGNVKGTYTTLWAKDKKGVGDYYWFRTYINDSIQARPGDIITAADNAFNGDGTGDGELFIVPIRENLSRPLRSGDQVRVEVLTITEDLFYFLFLVRDQLNNQGLFAVPPTNIPSNVFCINNNDVKVLGNFTMCGKAETQVINVP